MTSEEDVQKSRRRRLDELDHDGNEYDYERALMIG